MLSGGDVGERSATVAAKQATRAEEGHAETIQLSLSMSPVAAPIPVAGRVDGLIGDVGESQARVSVDTAVVANSRPRASIAALDQTASADPRPW